MTTRQQDQAERAEREAAADAAVKAATIFLAETADRPLTREQQRMADRAARIARVLTRPNQQTRGGR